MSLLVYECHVMLTLIIDYCGTCHQYELSGLKYAFLFFEIHEYEQVVTNSDMKIKLAETKLTAAETAMESMKVHCNEEIQKVREHSRQLSEQNTLLHKEIEKVGVKYDFAPCEMLRFKLYALYCSIQLLCW